jgi:hypothetical protein
MAVLEGGESVLLSFNINMMGFFCLAPTLSANSLNDINEISLLGFFRAASCASNCASNRGAVRALKGGAA